MKHKKPKSQIIRPQSVYGFRTKVSNIERTKTKNCLWIKQYTLINHSPCELKWLAKSQNKQQLQKLTYSMCGEGLTFNYLIELLPWSCLNNVNELQSL